MVRFVVELARALDEHDGVELTVVARRASVPFFDQILDGGSRVATVPDVPTAALSMLERHGPALGRLKQDVVHGPEHLLPRRTAARRVLTVHDMLFLDRPRDFGIVKRQLLRGRT